MSRTAAHQPFHGTFPTAPALPLTNRAVAPWHPVAEAFWKARGATLA